MRKLFLAALIAIMTLLLVLPASAQEDESWYVYLLDANNNVVLRVDNDGTQTEYAVPLQEGAYFNPNETGFALDGRFMSFCANVNNPFGAAGWSAYIVNLLDGAVMRTIDFGEVYNCVASAFNAEGTRIAVGLMNRFPGDPNANESLPYWELRIYDVISGEVVAGFTSDDPMTADVTLAEIGAEGEDPIVPRPISVSEGEVVFQSFPGVGMGGLTRVNVYRWDIEAGTIEEIEQRGIINSDFLPETGEIVAPASDPSLPAGEPGGPLPAYNIVNLTDAEGSTGTIYTNTEQIVTTTTFVNDGEAIAVTLLDPYDPEELLQKMTVINIDRSGEVQETVGEYQGYVVVEAAPGGLLVIYDIPQPNGLPGFALDYDGADGTSERLWEYSPHDETGTFWQLIYTSER